MSDTTNKVRRVSFADRREDDSKPWYVGYAELDEDPNGTHMLVPIEEWNQREAEIERLREELELFKSGCLARLEREGYVVWSANGELFGNYEDALSCTLEPDDE